MLHSLKEKGCIVHHGQCLRMEINIIVCTEPIAKGADVLQRKIDKICVWLENGIQNGTQRSPVLYRNPVWGDPNWLFLSSKSPSNHMNSHKIPLNPHKIPFKPKFKGLLLIPRCIVIHLVLICSPFQQ